MGFTEIFEAIILPAVGETLYMVIITILLSTIGGFLISITLYMTEENGLKPMPITNAILSFIVNVIRSFPFIILLVSIIPLTRAIVGTSIGVKAAIVPLTISCTPYMARLFDNSFRSINRDLVEAGRAFGLTDFQIMRKIVIKEAVPSLVNDITTSVIGLINSSSVAGTIGAGGLGSVAMLYGYMDFNNEIMYGTVLVIIIMVQIVQILGHKIYKIVK